MSGTKNFVEYVMQHFQSSYASRMALVDGETGDRLSYHDLDLQVRQFAAGIQARGLRNGDVVALFAPNSPSWAIPFLGTILAGGIVTTIQAAGFPGEAPFIYAPPGIDRVLHQTGAIFLVTVPPLLATAAACVAAAHCNVREILILESAGQQSGENHAPVKTLFGADIRVTAFREIFKDAASLEQQQDRAQEVAVKPYSAGIHGLPKGTLLTHHNVIASLTMLQASGRLDLSPQDAILAALPFAHIRGMMMALLFGLRNGAKIVTIPRVEPELLLRSLKNEEVTISFATPVCIGFYASHPMLEEFLPLKLRDIVCGGAPLDPELGHAAKKRLGSVNLRQCFSMTETSGAALLGDDGQIGSVGKLLPGMTCKIVNSETGELVAAGQPGELLLKGPSIFKGYCNDHQGESKADIVDSDGYLHTGDVGHADEEGNFFIVDRQKDLMKVQGYTVAPAEIEAVLTTCPGVQEAAVIGVPAPDAKSSGTGQVPKAFIVKAQGSEVTQADIKEFVAARMVAHKCLSFVEFVEALPKNPVLNKLMRNELRRMAGGLHLLF